MCFMWQVEKPEMNKYSISFSVELKTSKADNEKENE